MVAELGVRPADRVECIGLPGPVVGRPVQVEGLIGVVQRLPVTPAAFKHQGENVAGAGLAGAAVDLTIEVKGVPEVGVSVVEAAQPAVGGSQLTVGMGLPLQVS